MRPARIIACLDVQDGRIVKGVRFVELRDAGDPAAAAAAYSDAGVDELFLLNLSAGDRSVLLDTVRKTARASRVPLTVGGGVSTLADAAALLAAGADRISIMSAAVHDRELISRTAERFGSDRVVIAIDAQRFPGAEAGWEVFTGGGRNPTGLDAVEYAHQASAAGAGELLVTSMDRDGTTDGYDLELTRAVAEATPLPVIASGGAGSLADFAAAIRTGHAAAVLAASVFHFGTFTIQQVREHLQAEGIVLQSP